MPGSTVTTLPGSRTASDSGRSSAPRGPRARRRGRARGRTCRPSRPRSIATRDAASTSLPSAPGLTAASPSSWARQAEVVELAQAALRLAREERARAVGAVPVDDAAGVDDDERPLGDRLVTELRVRPRAVLAERDDRVERRAVGPGLVPSLLEPPGELRLRAPDERLAGELVVHAVGDRSGASQRLELAGVLDGAERLDEPLGRDDVDATAAQRLGAGEREVGRLDGDPAAGEQLGERRRSRTAASARTSPRRPPGRRPRTGSPCRGSRRPPGRRAAPRSSSRTRSGTGR